MISVLAVPKSIAISSVKKSKNPICYVGGIEIKRVEFQLKTNVMNFNA
jgi:hypothetical protein